MSRLLAAERARRIAATHTAVARNYEAQLERETHADGGRRLRDLASIHRRVAEIFLLDATYLSPTYSKTRKVERG